MSSLRRRPPISTRHAFALAFDLSVRRDALHSLVIPTLLRSPWILALALLPTPSQSDHPVQVVLLTTAALLGDFIVLLTVGAMLRFRARSVFNTPPEVHPAHAIECYARGLKRVPWLLVTEIVRNFTLLVGSFFFVIPGLVLGFKLAFATEAVVLSEPHLPAAFGRSFRLTEARFERWIEMIAVSVAFVFASILIVATLLVFFPGPGFAVWVAVARLLVTAQTPIIQYAWTFFYLRLIEAESPDPGIEIGPEVGPMYAAVAPQSGADPAAISTPTSETTAAPSLGV